MKRLLAILFLIPCVVFAQKDSILSGAYGWQQPVAKRGTITSAVLLEGKAYDFEWMQIAANCIGEKTGGKKFTPDTLEQMLIVKSGTFTIRVGVTDYTLTPNSVVVLMPGEIYFLTNASTTDAYFYSIKYRSKKAADVNSSGKSFVKIWEDIPYKVNNNGGGRRDFFEQPTVMQKRFEMHVTTLKEGLKSHEPHTHRAEEIILMINGETEMLLGDKTFKTQSGGFYYAGTNVLHGIKNIGSSPCMYFAIQFE